MTDDKVFVTVFICISVLFVCFLSGISLGGYIRLRNLVRSIFSSWQLIMIQESEKRLALQEAFSHSLLANEFKSESESLSEEINILMGMRNVSWRCFLNKSKDFLNCSEEMTAGLKQRFERLGVRIEAMSVMSEEDKSFFMTRLENFWAASNLSSFEENLFHEIVEAYNCQRNGLFYSLAREGFRFKKLITGDCF